MSKERTQCNRNSLLGARGGNVAVMAALTLPILVGSLALGVDWGYLGYQKRVLQNETDLAAISAAGDLDAPQSAIGTFLSNNGLQFDISSKTPPVGTTSATSGPLMAYTLGNYTADASLQPDARFVPGKYPINAVKVLAHRPADLAFARMFTHSPTISAEAIATTDGVAAFSIGSRLASLNGGILNAVLGSLLGTSLSLSVMDYNSLLDADVNVLSFLDQAATHLHLTADNYQEILKSRLTVGQFLDILAETDGVSASVRHLLQGISDNMSGGDGNGNEVTLSSLFDLGNVATLSPGAEAGLSANAGILDLLSAAAAIADGKHQVDLDIGAGVPGLAGVKVSLLVGEPPVASPWFAIGTTGAVVHTAQTRLKINAKIGGQNALAGTLVHLPIYLELADASATISNIVCSGAGPNDGEVDVTAKPGVANAWIGDLPSDDELADISPGVGPANPARLADIKLLGIHVDGSAHAAITNPEAATLDFMTDDIQNGTVKSVSTTSYASPLLSSLIGNLRLEVRAAGLTISLPEPLQAALAKTLAAATSPLDTVLSNVLAALGIRLGEADIRVTGLSCSRPVLVQ